MNEQRSSWRRGAIYDLAYDQVPKRPFIRPIRNLPEGLIPIKWGRLSEKLILLCHPNNINKIPKPFPCMVQADFSVEYNFVRNFGLDPVSGITYLLLTSINR